MLKLIRNLTLLAVMFVVTACGKSPTGASDPTTVHVRVVNDRPIETELGAPSPTMTPRQVPQAEPAVASVKTKSKKLRTKELWWTEWNDFCTGRTYSGWMTARTSQWSMEDGTTTWFSEDSKGHAKLYDADGNVAIFKQVTGSEVESNSGGLTVFGETHWRLLPQGADPNSTIGVEASFGFGPTGNLIFATSSTTTSCQGQ